jgi:hypothetical protein
MHWREENCLQNFTLNPEGMISLGDLGVGWKIILKLILTSIKLVTSMLFLCLAYPSTLKIEVICSSETSVDFQRTTRGYIPEARTLRK